MRSLYYQLVRWNVWVFRRSFFVFVQYFSRVLKNVDNEQVRKSAICDVFVCKQKSRSFFGRTRGKQGKFPFMGRKTRLAIVSWKLLWKVSGTCLFTGAQPKAGTGHKMQTVSFFQRYIVRDVSLSWDISPARYFWECSLTLAGSLKSYPPFLKARGMADSREQDYIIAFWGRTRSPTFTMH